jgi:hypothetical protein
MNKDEFYLNRILWKAKKNKLIENGCLLFDEIDISRKMYLNDSVVLQGRPILLFWSNENLWTLLTTKELASKFSSLVNIILLDSIEKKIKLEPVVSEERQATKLRSEFLFLGESGTRIWAPNGKLIFGLWNTLGMFPLSGP